MSGCISAEATAQASWARALLWGVIVVGLVAGCASVPTDQPAGATCLRASECAAGLACVEGVCSTELGPIGGMLPNLDAAADAIILDGAPDGAPDGALDGATDGSMDSAVADSAMMDSARPDSAMSDTGTPDTGPADTGTPDTGPADTGTPDTGPADTGTPDTGPADTGTPDTGPADTGTPDAAAAG